jgi:hypothetical protein
LAEEARHARDQDVLASETLGDGPRAGGSGSRLLYHAADYASLPLGRQAPPGGDGYDRKVRRLIPFTDAISVIGGALLAHRLRYASLPDSSLIPQVLFAGAITVAWLAFFGLYGRRGRKPAEHLGQGILAITAGMVSTLVVTFSTDVYIPRSWLALTWIVAVTLFVLSRVTWQVSMAGAVPR